MNLAQWATLLVAMGAVIATLAGLVKQRMMLVRVSASLLALALVVALVSIIFETEDGGAQASDARPIESNPLAPTTSTTSPPASPSQPAPEVPSSQEAEPSSADTASSQVETPSQAVTSWTVSPILLGHEGVDFDAKPAARNEEYVDLRARRREGQAVIISIAYGDQKLVSFTGTPSLANCRAAFDEAQATDEDLPAGVGDSFCIATDYQQVGYIKITETRPSDSYQKSQVRLVGTMWHDPGTYDAD
ncbi:hypothetical protein [Streptomyces ortus]|uniref:Serine/threonine protein kinase n=1 Tax=Streptomyces ortus TaxID=2867268 RepID=A0ABT3V6T2_9ACTN|nr:hypothetical protein [Streptomyces ortus]MCX4235685.1 hypothetical protein [Streptomyces ortus]